MSFPGPRLYMILVVPCDELIASILLILSNSLKKCHRREREREFLHSLEEMCNMKASFCHMGQVK